MNFRPHVLAAIVAGLFAAVAGFLAHNYIFTHSVTPLLSEDQRAETAAFVVGWGAALFGAIGVAVGVLVFSLGRPRR